VLVQGKRNTGSVVIDMIGFGAGTDTLQIKGGTSGAANAISFYDTGGFLGTFYNSNFGIGRTAPDYKLVISNGNAEGIELGPGYVSGNNLWQNYNRTTSAYIKETHYASTYAFLTAGGNTGNVGIGTASPGSKLTVLGPSNAASNTPSDAIVDIHGTSTAHLLMGVANVSPYGAWINTDATGQPLVLQGPGGNVGIGNRNPLARLTIGSSQGSSLDFSYDSSNGYRNNISNYWNSSADTRMDFNIGRTANVAPVTVMSVGYNSNVGIGTTSPTNYKLEVNGTVEGSAFSVDGASSRIFAPAGATYNGSGTIQREWNSNGLFNSKTSR